LSLAHDRIHAALARDPSRSWQPDSLDDGPALDRPDVEHPVGIVSTTPPVIAGAIVWTRLARQYTTGGERPSPPRVSIVT
jgi:hypothetical protein